MGPQVQPKCFRHAQRMRNNWELRKRGYLIRFGHTEALLLKKNMTLNGHFSRPAETDPYKQIYFFALFILKEAEAWKSWRGWNVDSVENMGALWGKWSLLILDPECFRPINFANFADFYTSSRAQYVFKLPFHWGFLRGCSKLYREKTKLFEIDINGMNKRLFSKNIEEEKKSSLLSERQCYNCYLAFMN